MGRKPKAVMKWIVGEAVLDNRKIKLETYDETKKLPKGSDSSHDTFVMPDREEIQRYHCMCSG